MKTAGFRVTGETAVCLACGSPAVRKAVWRCPACEGRPGLGDMVKAGLARVGITEERVSRAIGRPCGCGRRAAKLNELGHKYLGLPPGQTPAT